MKDDDTYVNPKEFIKEAIARGIAAEDQWSAMNDALTRCNKLAERMPTIVGRNNVRVRCMKIGQKVSILANNMAKINKAISGDSKYFHSPLSADQEESDRLYSRKYWEYITKSPAEIEEALDHLNKQPLNLVRRAWRTALLHLLKKLDFDPPILDPNAPPPAQHPSDTPDEQPDLGDKEMSASSVRGGRQRGKYPRKLVEALMPVEAYWVVETARSATVHYVGECPACPAEQADVQQLDEAMHPLHLADELGGRACGTCLRMMEADEKKGFLFASATPKRTLAIYRDHIDYESAGFLSFGAKQFTWAPDEFEDVYFTSRRELFFITPSGEEINISFDRDAEADIACEALRRLGWPVAES